MPPRRRSPTEFEATPDKSGRQVLTIGSAIGGYNGYTSPDLLSPQFWVATSNVYAGQFGTIRRARVAPFFNSTASGFGPPQTIAISTVVRTGNVVTVTTTANHGLSTGQWVKISGVSDSSFNTVSGVTTPAITVTAVNTFTFPQTAPNGASSGGTVTLARRIVSMYSMSDILNNVNWVLFDNNDVFSAGGPQWLIQNPINPFFSVNFTPLQANPLLNTWEANLQTFPFLPLGGSIFNGPYSRTSINNIIFEGNGQFRGKILINGVSILGTSHPATPTIEYWGIDAPDASPQVALSAGSTKTIAAAPTGAVRSNGLVTITTTAAHGLSNFQWVTISGVTDTTFNNIAGTAYQITVTGSTTFTFPQPGANSTSGAGTVTFGITKTVGRSYTYEWENANTGATSAPSPATAYILYNGQVGAITCIEGGTIAVGSGSNTITGTGTNFSPAWVGKALICPFGLFAVNSPIITAVANTTSMTVSHNATGNFSAQQFNVVDPQVTHIRLYATGDGAAVYFLIARNIISSAFGGYAPFSALTFNDNANSEPPNPPFSSEIEQIYNVPPPIGKFVQSYQGRVLVYGVQGNLQTFFYTNMEATVVGNPPECSSPLNTVTMPIGDGSLFGMAELPTGLVIWSNRQDMFKLTGLLSDNTLANSQQLGATIQRLPYKIGCASPYATTITSLGAFWLSSDREVWLFTDHYAPKNVGKPVQDVLNRINGNRLAFAKMTYYKRGERSWLALAVALDGSTFNNKLLLLDLDLLASNGQPSYFTFDMATNAPTWYQYDINCEGLVTSYDQNSTNHLFVGDVDLITDTDWQPGYYTIGAEQYVAAFNKLHAIGNEAPEMIKTMEWMRAMTNQSNQNLPTQGWQFSIDSYDDDVTVIGVNSSFQNLIPGVHNNNAILGLEYSPALFKFGGVTPIKGRRFQLGCVFPSQPGLFELRGYQISLYNVVGR